jgi:trypsin-like peptidase
MDKVTEFLSVTEPAFKFAEPQACWGEIGGPPLTAERVSALLDLQEQLSVQQLRGNMEAVRSWVDAGDLCGCVVDTSRSVGMLLSEDTLIQHGTSPLGDTFAPSVGRYGRGHQLMPRDYLSNEWRWAWCGGSCFLVAPDIVMTAAHCIGLDALDLIAKREFYAVFDFHAGANARPPATMSRRRSVFAVQEIGPSGGGANEIDDWIMLKLDRPVTDSPERPCLRVADRALDLSRHVYSLGHPNAITLRYARSQRVWRNASTGCYEAHLDAYDGISGAPVFDATSHMVVGMMIRSCPVRSGVVNTHTTQFLSPLCIGQDERCGAIIVPSQQFVRAIPT